MMTGRFLVATAMFLAVAAMSSAGTAEEVPMALKLGSTAFAPNAPIPARYTCDGEDVSPPLHWSGLPANAKSLALIMDDPDAPDPAAPRITWVHWVLYDLPVSGDGLAEGAATQLPAGTREGVNGWKATGFRGSCPPVGNHRYFFKLYALDTVLPDLHQPDKAQLLKAVEGHVLAQAELVGTYQRKR